MKRLTLAVVLLTTLAICASAVNAKTTGGQEKKSLYTRLGGYDAIALVVDDFIGRLATDKRFERFFTGFSVDSKKRLRQHILDQFCAAAGAGRHPGRAAINSSECERYRSIWSFDFGNASV